MNLTKQELEIINKLRSRKDKVICSNCEEEIIGEYFKCNYHKTIFCEDCATNYGQKKIKAYLAPHCDAIKPKDCILEKIKDENNN